MARSGGLGSLAKDENGYDFNHTEYFVLWALKKFYNYTAIAEMERSHRLVVAAVVVHGVEGSRDALS